MNKQEVSIVVLLFLALLGWGYMNRATPPPPGVTPPGLAPEQVESLPRSSAPETAAWVSPAADADPVVSAAQDTDAEPVPPDREPEVLTGIANELVQVTLTSRGGGIQSVRLQEYRETRDPDSELLVLDFSSRPTLSLEGLPGMGTNHHFTVESLPGGRAARITRTLPNGLVFERHLALGEGYELTVEDRFVNEAQEDVSLDGVAFMLGPMQSIQSEAKVRGMAYLGADTLAAHEEARVRHWGKQFPSFFGHRGSAFSCAGPNTMGMPMTAAHALEEPIDWVAVKNKFFVQILQPEDGGAGVVLHTRRDAENPNVFSVVDVAAGVDVPALRLAPAEQHVQRYRYYVGPKNFERLKSLGPQQGRIMEFGWSGWLCKPLLWLLNRLYRLIPNYGVAIILLTIMVRMVFWPVTRKSTESMKKMQQIQPEVTKLREKYKDNPQKMNQEVMLLYRRHNVNPMMGCLPMLIQIPVFIALFTVLRSAVELRFAPFLWIRDLSEPEGLLAGVLPLPLNILPLFMAATMFWQQKLTPTAGDPQQQKVMMFMPLFMLVLLYNMPSALVLYWSVSQCLSILQLVLQKREGGASVTPARR